MDYKSEAATPVTKTHSYGFILKSSLIVVCGILLTVFILYFSLPRGGGASYAESFKIISSLRQTIIYKAIVIYATTSFFIFAGVLVISLLYSHKIAGPLHRMGMFARKAAEGDFTDIITLRKNDVLHPMAKDLNDIASAYKNTLLQVETEINEIKNLLATTDETTAQNERENILKISERADKLNEILYRIKL